VQDYSIARVYVTSCYNIRYAYQAKTAESLGSDYVVCSGESMSTRVVSSPIAVSLMVPRLVCSIAQPSIFTAVTAMLRVDASLSQGTTSALTFPCARAY